MQPSTFLKESSSITLAQAKSIFKEMGVEVPSNVNIQNINTILKQTKELTEDQIDTFYQKASEIVQKEISEQINEYIKTLDKNN